MNERQLIRFVLVIVLILGIVTGIAYFYFIGNPLTRFRLPGQREKTVEQPLLPTPSPVFPELLYRVADAIGTVDQVDGHTLTIQTQIGKSPFLIEPNTPIFQILTEEQRDPPTTSPIDFSQLTVGDQVSIYLNEDQTIQAIFVVKTSGR